MWRLALVVLGCLLCCAPARAAIDLASVRPSASLAGGPIPVGDVDGDGRPDIALLDGTTLWTAPLGGRMRVAPD